MLTRLGAFMHHKGLSQAQLGDLLGVAGASVSRYLSGDRAPRRKVSDRLKALTRGVIHAGNYADPVSEEAALVMLQEINNRQAAEPGEVAHG